MTTAYAEQVCACTHPDAAFHGLQQGLDADGSRAYHTAMLKHWAIVMQSGLVEEQIVLEAILGAAP
eukprot:1842052-Amphidinium_carterae.1